MRPAQADLLKGMKYPEQAVPMSFFQNRAMCKTIFSPTLCLMLKILSFEYQSYACGKISRMV
jgi:hypothetical protein